MPYFLNTICISQVRHLSINFRIDQVMNLKHTLHNDSFRGDSKLWQAKFDLKFTGTHLCKLIDFFFVGYQDFFFVGYQFPTYFSHSLNLLTGISQFDLCYPSICSLHVYNHAYIYHQYLWIRVRLSLNLFPQFVHRYLFTPFFAKIQCTNSEIQAVNKSRDT